MRMDKLTSKFQAALADAQSLAVGRDQQLIEPAHVLLALLGGHPLELLHAALSAAGAVGKALHSLGKQLMQIPHQPCEGAHRIPQ